MYKVKKKMPNLIFLPSLVLSGVPRLSKTATPSSCSGKNNATLLNFVLSSMHHIQSAANLLTLSSLPPADWPLSSLAWTTRWSL